MPRYFFNVIEGEGRRFADEEGQWCSGPEKAEAVAARLADELGKDPQYQGFLVRVTDDAGNEVALVRVPPPPQG